MSEIYGEISAAGVILGTLIAQTGAKGETGAPGKDGKDYVLTESDKEEIASMINDDVQSQLDSLSNKNTEQDKNIQKNADDIEKINKKDTTQDNLIEELQTKVVNLESENTSLKNQIPSGEATGNPIHLTDSSNMECEMVPIGGAEQETRSGKNKLQLYFSDKTTNGVTITKNEDDSITLNGTATATINFLNLGKFLYEVAKGTFKGCLTYKSGSMKDGSAGIYFSSSTTSGTNKGGTTLEAKNKSFALSSTVTEDANIYPYIYINSGTTFDNFTFYFQVVNSDVDDFEYEPYGAMPSPDYPSEIVTVGQNVNIFNGEFRQGSASGSSTTRLYSTQEIKVKTGKTYTIFTDLDTKIYRYSVNLNTQPFPTSVSSFYDAGWKTVEKTTFTPTQDGYLGVPVSRIDNTELVLSDISKFKFKVVEGTEVGGYSPYGQGSVEIKVDNGLETTDTNYQSYTKVLPIQKEFVKIGDVEDTFVKVDGKWYEKHDIPKYELTGNESFSRGTTRNGFYYFEATISDLAGNYGKINRILCNVAKEISARDMYEVTSQKDLIGTNSKNIRLMLSDINTVSELQAYLSEQYANETPATLYYLSTTPKLIECTEEQSEILNSFCTYKNVTNVSMIGIGTLKVNYKKDLETIINKLLATSVAE